MRNGTLLPPVRPLPAGAAELRAEVRDFLAAERAKAECFAELGRAALGGATRAGGLWPWLSGSP